MSVPVHTVPYGTQLTNIGVDPTISFDIDQNWVDADFFEINRLPFGFTFNPTTNLLGGAIASDMAYYIAVRAGNADGLSLWSELFWVGLNSTSQRLLIGPSQVIWQEIPVNPTPPVLRLNRATLSGRQSTWNAGTLFTNDIPDNDGNAAEYDASDLDSEFTFVAGKVFYILATRPGWEVVLDRTP